MVKEKDEMKTLKKILDKNIKKVKPKIKAKTLNKLSCEKYLWILPGKENCEH